MKLHVNECELYREVNLQRYIKLMIRIPMTTAQRIIRPNLVLYNTPEETYSGWG